MTSNRDKGRNDTLLFLIENSSGLKGRTFNQWQYATNKANFDVNTISNLKGLNSWAFTESQKEEALNFAKLGNVMYLLSTVKFDSSTPNFGFVGECLMPGSLIGKSLPFKSRYAKLPIGNQTLESSIYIYTPKISDSINQKMLTIENINPTSMEIRLDCRTDPSYTLPVNYSENLIITSGKKIITAHSSYLNFTKLEIPDQACNNDRMSNIIVTSYSKIMYSNIVLFLFLFFSFLSCTFRLKQRASA
jgi:hypothetical protein